MNSAPSPAKQIFLDAIENHAPNEWPEYLDTACGGDAELRQRVEKLLDAHRADASLLDAPAMEIELTLDDDRPVSERPGDSIGPYKLIEQIGEGGFGIVFLAEQSSPVRREVAIKIVKAGMDSKEVVARFAAERQALAMMDHPNIAKVLGGGATESGRPYFVMELVRGIPINEYCDQCKLTTRERLKLFSSVCQAIQHAHQKGVIHRDLKPSNVLIAMQDGVPTPRIIDFGVAKAVNQQLTEHTLKTRFAQIIGTPLYMSPEQAELSPLGVDTRSDIYSLGVLLYELLTGTTPFDKERLHSASFDELRRIIRHEEPPRPSTRLSTLAAETAATIADRHRAEPPQLQQTLRGDLDWIVMRAMEKDRTRRYESASSLARDVERYLNDEPVEACPPTIAYRIRKFARRNKAAIATLALVAAALVAGTGIASWQAVRATRERDRAIAAEKIAEAEAARSAQVAQLLKDMLAAAGPSVARGRDATLLREVLDGTFQRVERDLAGQPEIQGDMWFTLGTTYDDIGDYRKAVASFERAVESFRIAPGEPNAKLALTLGYLGRSKCFVGKTAEGTLDAQAGLDMARLTGDQDVLARCLQYRAASSKPYGYHTKEDAPFLAEALEVYRAMGNRPLDEAFCMSRLAACEIGQDMGESLARRAYEILLENVGENDARTVGAQWVWGQTLLTQSKAAEAEAVLRETLDGCERVYDQHYPTNQIVRRKLAKSLVLLGDRQAAQEVLEGAAASTQSSSAIYLLFYEDVIRHLVHLGRYEDAKPILDELRAKFDDVQSTYGTDHRLTKEYRNALAEMYARIDEPEEARRWRSDLESEAKEGSDTDESRGLPLEWEAARVLGIEEAELLDEATNN